MTYCKQCAESFVAHMDCDVFCSFSCMILYDNKIDRKEAKEKIKEIRKEERIVKLETEVALLKKKLELCLEKLGLDDCSEINSDNDF